MDDARQIAQREIDADEEILWAGRPNPARMSTRTLPVLLFGIPFTAFAVFWIVNAYNMGNSGPSFGPGGGIGGFFPLFGIPFVLVGLGMLLSPLIAFHKGTQTVYAITNRRALIIEAGNSRSVKSYPFSNMDNLERVENADGSGDIVFLRETRRGSKGRTYTEPIGFFGVPEVRAVERMLRGGADFDG